MSKFLNVKVQLAEHGRLLHDILQFLFSHFLSLLFLLSRSFFNLLESKLEIAACLVLLVLILKVYSEVDGANQLLHHVFIVLLFDSAVVRLFLFLNILE